MEIKEDSFDEIDTDKKQTTHLTLRKQKIKPKAPQKDNIDIFKEEKNVNDLLPGEIELKNEDIVFSHKKRQRAHNSSSLFNLSDENESNLIINSKAVNDEEKNLSEKALEIFKELQIPPTPGIQEDEYDSKYHEKRELIVSKLLKDEDLIMNQRKLACTTKNKDVYCAILDNFNTFCYYNNLFMVNSHEYIDKIVQNAFSFEDKKKTIPLALKFANSIMEFGFFEDFHQKFIDFFINLLLDENKLNDINNIPRAKIYIYYIIYLIFKDSWENIKIEKEVFKPFIGRVLFDININDHELTEIIIQLINSLCDNVLYSKIFKNQPIDIPIASEVNKYMFKLISEIIKKLGPNNLNDLVNKESINFIVRQSFNIIIKIISGINIINENNINLQETLVSKENKQFYYEFILMFSNLNLNEKSFFWLLDIMAKFAEITYYSDIYLKDDIISIIFEKFIVKKNYMCQVFQFMRSLVETGPLFKYYSACEKFFKFLNDLDIDKNQFLTNVHFLFIVKELLSHGEENKCLDEIYDRLCCIHAKEKIEQIYYKYGNEEVIHKKYNEIMPILDELNKKIQID